MLVGGQWVPTFPKARYLFGRVEYEHWSTQTERADMLPVFADSIRPIFERGLADLVEWDHQMSALRFGSCRARAIHPATPAS